MKKAYLKPEIIFEDFTLSVHIAGDCVEIVDNPTEGTCGYPIRGGTVFIGELTGCTHPQSDNDPYNGFCYHVPTDTTQLFNS